MSNFAIEKLLWQATNSPADAETFRQEPENYLANFRVDPEEAALLSSWDVAALADRGVNPMLLLMAYSAVQRTTDMRDYVMKINGPRG